MKKNYLVLALVAMTSLAEANTCTVFNPVTVNNNSYTCNLATTLPGVSGQQVTACTFSFANCSLTSRGSGLLYCNIDGVNIGTCTQTTTSWVCNLTSTGLTDLNNCINSGTTCNFGISCTGGWSVGGCTANYTCTTPPINHSVPDAASTASLLGLGLAGASLLRRKLA